MVRFMETILLKPLPVLAHPRQGQTGGVEAPLLMPTLTKADSFIQQATVPPTSPEAVGVGTQKSKQVISQNQPQPNKTLGWWIAGGALVATGATVVAISLRSGHEEGSFFGKLGNFLRNLGKKTENTVKELAPAEVTDRYYVEGLLKQQEQRRQLIQEAEAKDEAERLAKEAAANLANPPKPHTTTSKPISSSSSSPSTENTTPQKTNQPNPGPQSPKKKSSMPIVIETAEGNFTINSKVYPGVQVPPPLRPRKAPSSEPFIPSNDTSSALTIIPKWHSTFEEDNATILDANWTPITPDPSTPVGNGTLVKVEPRVFRLPPLPIPAPNSVTSIPYPEPPLFAEPVANINDWYGVVDNKITELENTFDNLCRETHSTTEQKTVKVSSKIDSKEPRLNVHGTFYTAFDWCNFRNERINGRFDPIKDFLGYGISLYPSFNHFVFPGYINNPEADPLTKGKLSLMHTVLEAEYILMRTWREGMWHDFFSPEFPKNMPDIETNKTKFQAPIFDKQGNLVDKQNFTNGFQNNWFYWNAYEHVFAPTNLPLFMRDVTEKILPLQEDAQAAFRQRWQQAFFNPPANEFEQAEARHLVANFYPDYMEKLPKATIARLFNERGETPENVNLYTADRPLINWAEMPQWEADVLPVFMNELQSQPQEDWLPNPWFVRSRLVVIANMAKHLSQYNPVPELRKKPGTEHSQQWQESGCWHLPEAAAYQTKEHLTQADYPDKQTLIDAFKEEVWQPVNGES